VLEQKIFDSQNKKSAAIAGGAMKRLAERRGQVLNLFRRDLGKIADFITRYNLVSSRSGNCSLTNGITNIKGQKYRTE
jgi:hypothetical protein